MSADATMIAPKRRWSWLLWFLNAVVTGALLFLVYDQLTQVRTSAVTGEAAPSFVQPIFQAVVPTEVAGIIAPVLPFQEPLARPAGRILFARDGGIWVWNQGDVRPLTPGGQGAESPRWSPDGSGIAYVVRGRGFADIWLMDSSGQEPRQITRNGSPGISRQVFALAPAWKPDGREIAYLSDASSWDMALWLMDASGRNPRRVSFLADYVGGLQGPSWTADGKIVTAAFFPGKKQQIYLFDIVSNRWTPLTDAPDGAYDPRVSPDGKRIIYVARNAGKHDLWALDLTTSQSTQITTDGLSRSPEWVPSGDQLLYISQREKNWDIWTLSVVTESDGTVTYGKGRPVTRGANVDPLSGLSWLRQP